MVYCDSLRIMEGLLHFPPTDEAYMHIIWRDTTILEKLGNTQCIQQSITLYMFMDIFYLFIEIFYVYFKFSKYIKMIKKNI